MCRCSRWNSGRLQHRRHIDTARGAHVLFGGRCAGREGAGEVGDAGNEKQGVWSVRDRGGGTSSPSPSAPPPVAISPRSSARGDPGEKPGTVAHRLHPGYGSPPATSRVQLLTRYRPGYGCSPDIATHCPRPREGAGEERRRRGRGGGCQRGIRVACRRRRGRGGGCRQKRMGIPHEGAGGVGGASRRVWVLPRKSRRSKGASELRGPPLPKARAGWGVPARYTATLQRSRQGGDLSAYAAAGKERTPLPAGLSRTSVAFARVYRRRRPES